MNPSFKENQLKGINPTTTPPSNIPVSEYRTVEEELQIMESRLRVVGLNADREEPLLLGNYLSAGGYFMYRYVSSPDLDFVQIPDAIAFTHFLSAFGTESGNIWDFDSDGVVGSSDLQRVLAGYGTHDTYFGQPHSLDEIPILGQFSSGWIIEIPGWSAAFLKVTPSDEGGQFIPSVLKSFFIEGFITETSSFVKFYYHRY